jgi:hypothetical protein
VYNITLQYVKCAVFFMSRVEALIEILNRPYTRLLEEQAAKTQGKRGRVGVKSREKLRDKTTSRRKTVIAPV